MSALPPSREAGGAVELSLALLSPEQKPLLELSCSKVKVERDLQDAHHRGAVGP